MNILQAFLFCPRCGSEFSDKNNGYLGCGKCGLRYYTSPKPCAGILPVNENGEILLTERALEPHKGKLDMLGGFLKEGETLEEGALREAKEELGVILDKLEYVTSYTHSYTYQDIDYILVTAIFSTKISSTTDLHVNDDVASYKFFKPQDTPIEMLAFPELKTIIDSLAKRPGV